MNPIGVVEPRGCVNPIGVVPKKGAIIRQGAGLDTPEVARLPRSTLLALEGDEDAHGRVRVLVPHVGFASAKVLGPSDRDTASSTIAEELTRSAMDFHYPYGAVFSNTRTDGEWRDVIGSELAFNCLRHHYTEPAGGGEFNDFFPEDGEFCCRGCALPLYPARSKFPDKGWIAFAICLHSGPVCHVGVAAGAQNSIELHCTNCKGHLGHLFSDGGGEASGHPHDRH